METLLRVLSTLYLSYTMSRLEDSIHHQYLPFRFVEFKVMSNTTRTQKKPMARRTPKEPKRFTMDDFIRKYDTWPFSKEE